MTGPRGKPVLDSYPGPPQSMAGILAEILTVPPRPRPRQDSSR